MTDSSFPFLGFGLGLRPQHYDDVLQGSPRVSWFEVISENFMGLFSESEIFSRGPQASQPPKGIAYAGRPLERLLKVREKFPVVLHGVSMSIGSADPLNLLYLERLKDLIAAIEPAWVSDHLCWTSIHGHFSHDLLPLPYTHEAIQHVVDRIQKVQEFLKRPILIENVSSYAEFKQAEMSEPEFVRDIVLKSGCGLLLDLNNIFVSQFNHGTSARKYLETIPLAQVGQIHLAGPSEQISETPSPDEQANQRQATPAKEQGQAERSHHLAAEEHASQRRAPCATEQGRAGRGHHLTAEEHASQGRATRATEQGRAGGGHHLTAEEHASQGRAPCATEQGRAGGGHHLTAEEHASQGRAPCATEQGRAGRGRHLSAEEHASQRRAHSATEQGRAERGRHLIDTHDHPVRPEVWELYRWVVARRPEISTMVEWDDDIPEFARLEDEILIAKEIYLKAKT